MTATAEALAWMDDAVCASVGSDPFFEDKGGSAATARRICATCPVAAQCLQTALDDPELYGVWGGTTYMERRALRKTR